MYKLYPRHATMSVQAVICKNVSYSNYGPLYIYVLLNFDFPSHILLIHCHLEHCMWHHFCHHNTKWSLFQGDDNTLTCQDWAKWHQGYHPSSSSTPYHPLTFCTQLLWRNLQFLLASSSSVSAWAVCFTLGHVVSYLSMYIVTHVHIHAISKIIIQADCPIG